jgi:hypothetical protein
LDTSPSCRNEAFYGSSVQSPSELLLLGLDAGDDWDSKKVFINLTVELQDLADFGIGFGFGEERGVTLLPQVLASSEEGFWVNVRGWFKNLFLGLRGFLNSQRTTLFH